jgi:hypothetical protein
MVSCEKKMIEMFTMMNNAFHIYGGCPGPHFESSPVRPGNMIVNSDTLLKMAPHIRRISQLVIIHRKLTYEAKVLTAHIYQLFFHPVTLLDLSKGDGFYF